MITAEQTLSTCLLPWYISLFTKEMFAEHAGCFCSYTLLTIIHLMIIEADRNQQIQGEGLTRGNRSYIPNQDNQNSSRKLFNHQIFYPEHQAGKHHSDNQLNNK